MTRSELTHWAVASLLAAAMAMQGCTSARPYTHRERVLFGHAIAGQSLDVLSTSALLSDDRFEEGNPLLPSDAASIAVVKLAVMGAAYLVGEAKPEWRESIWLALGIFGYGGAAWNTYQIIDNDVEPWR